MAERSLKSEITAVGVYDVDEGGVRPREVAVLAGVHVQRISRVQSGDSAYLKARFSLQVSPAVFSLLG